MNHYEAVFILNPVLSEKQIKETVKEYETFLTGRGGEIIHKEDWGLKNFAYPIQKKKSGFYHLLEFKIQGEHIAPFELQLRRDDSVMRYLTVRLDKDAIAYAERRKEKLAQKK